MNHIVLSPMPLPCPVYINFSQLKVPLWLQHVTTLDILKSSRLVWGISHIHVSERVSWLPAGKLTDGSLIRKCRHLDEIYVTGYTKVAKMITDGAAIDTIFVKMATRSLWFHLSRAYNELQHDVNMWENKKIACLLSSLILLTNVISLIHYNDVILGVSVSQITNFTSVYSTVYSQRRSKKTSKNASLAFVRGLTGDRWISRTNGQ